MTSSTVMPNATGSRRGRGNDSKTSLTSQPKATGSKGHSDRRDGADTFVLSTKKDTINDFSIADGDVIEAPTTSTFASSNAAITSCSKTWTTTSKPHCSTPARRPASTTRSTSDLTIDPHTIFVSEPTNTHLSCTPSNPIAQNSRDNSGQAPQACSCNEEVNGSSGHQELSFGLMECPELHSDRLPSQKSAMLWTLLGL